MKHTILISLALITVLITSIFSAIDVNYVEPVKNGDQLDIRITEVPANVQVRYLLLMKKNHGIVNWKEFVLLDKQDLKKSSNGIIEGKVTVNQLDVNDNIATIWVVLDNGNTIILEKDFSVLGDEEEIFSPLDAGTFSITDRDGGTFDAADTASATGSGFDPNETDFLWSFQELDAGDNIVQSTSTTDEILSVDGSGNLTGDAVRDGTVFNTNAVKIQLFGFFLGSSGAVTSTNTLPITETNPPDLTSATVTSFTNIRLVFNEAVSEIGGDSRPKIILGGTDGSGLTKGTLTAVGSQPTTTWDLEISGLTDRDPDVTVAYDSTQAAAGSLQDAAGNETKNTSPAIIAADGIEPGATSLDAPTLTTLMGSNVTFTATVTGASSDNSMSQVEFQGSADGSSGWSTVATDNVNDDNTYSATYNFGTKYAYWRALAVDDNSNTTNSSAVGSFIDAYRIQFTTTTTPLNAGEVGAFTITIQDNYATAVSYGSNLSFNLTTTQSSTGTFYSDAGGTNPITSVVITTGNTAANFYYADNQSSSTPTLIATEAAANLPDVDDSVTVTINAASIDEFRVTTENSQNESAATGFTVIVTAWDNDGGDVATDYAGTHSLDFTNTATASPDGTNPDTSGITDGDYTFTAGVCTTSAITFYNAGETPTITVTDGSTTTNGSFGAAAGVTVNAGSLMEVRIKTADETVDGNYNNNVFGTATYQGPTQANPDKSVNVYSVHYDDYGNLLADAVGIWSASPTSLGSWSGGNVGVTDALFVFDNATGDTATGTLNFTSFTSPNPSDVTGTITVDDDDGATVTGFGVTLDDEDNTFVYASWNGTSSGDNGTNGIPSSYDIRWTPEVNGQIDTDGEWNSATSVGSSGKPAFSSGVWHVDMSGFPAGGKYFAIRSFDDVGNVSVLGSGSYTTSPDYPLPVELSTFSAKAGYGKITLEWETSSELNNEGFYLLRSLKEDQDFEQLNSEIIPGNGNSNTAHSYTFVDEDVNENTTYYYKLSSKNFNGQVLAYTSVVSATALEFPNTFNIAQNYPNPFNPETHFRFSIAEQSRASLKIYNVLGQKIRTIFDNRLFEPGVYENFSWNATDDSGNSVANGIYYYKFQVLDRNIQQVKKMLYLK